MRARFLMNDGMVIGKKNFTAFRSTLRVKGSKVINNKTIVYKNGRILVNSKDDTWSIRIGMESAEEIRNAKISKQDEKESDNAEHMVGNV